MFYCFSSFLCTCEWGTSESIELPFEEPLIQDDLPFEPARAKRYDVLYKLSHNSKLILIAYILRHIYHHNKRYQVYKDQYRRALKRLTHT